jgi:hypothetical protein
MHSYNTHLADIYEKPNSKRLEHLYNRLFKNIPTTVTFSDNFEMDSLKAIEEHFDIFSSDITVVGSRFVEENVWVGKEGEYKDILLHSSYRSPDGDHPMLGAVYGNSVKKEDIDSMHVSVRAACKDREEAKRLCDLLLPFKLQLKNKIYMLTASYGELNLSPLPTMDVNSNLALNYGSEFEAFHEKLMDSLKTKTSGLYLFSGPPGTGKSSYIKYLTTCDIGRKIVYIPGGMIEQLVSPEMVPLLVENKNIILVIEDAEKALISREVSANTDMVQTVLNLTSGFLGDAANVSIIATFNTSKDNIDSALLRKGRLKLSYEFDKLSLDDTIKLAESLGLNTSGITEGMTLADIYHMEEQPGYEKPEEKRVGFF